jgi:hypothetical protein
MTFTEILLWACMDWGGGESEGTGFQCKWQAGFRADDLTPEDTEILELP